MRIALDGHSSLDLPKLNVRTKADAQGFLQSYGYDVGDPVVREEVWRIYFQAVAFIRDQLLERGEKIPQEFLTRGSQSDILKLIVEASGQARRGQTPSDRQAWARGRWSCAILRVMHIISHLDNDVRLEFFNAAREQIFARFDGMIKPIGEERRRWRFGKGAEAVRLVRYIKKERKERNSILIKLLSKPSAAVEEIYDRIGLRFVVDTRLDAYRLVQLMFSQGVVSPANLQPGRAVNSLLPLNVLKESWDRCEEEFQAGKLSLRGVRKQLEKLEQEALIPLGMLRNPNSSRWYRAIQFTGRQLIVAPDPTFAFWTVVLEQLKRSRAASLALKKIPISIRETRSFYYPFEVQILDKESYVESIGGRSRHRDYKQKQRLMARNRVLRDLV